MSINCCCILPVVVVSAGIKNQGALTICNKCQANRLLSFSFALSLSPYCCLLSVCVWRPLAWLARDFIWFSCCVTLARALSGLSWFNFLPIYEKLMEGTNGQIGLTGNRGWTILDKCWVRCATKYARNAMNCVGSSIIAAYCERRRQ